MTKSEYLFLNLGEAQAAEISQTIANKTAQKILEHLKSGATTESDLSLKLKIPLSTIHYNVQQLVKSGLVIGDQYHYSQKGREVSHYRLTNKLIVIVPQRTAQSDALMKALIPAILVLVAGTGFVSYLVSKLSAVAQPTMDAAPMMMAKTASASAPAMSEGANAAMTTAPMMANDAYATTAATAATSEPHYALIFLIGGLVLVGASLLGMWLWQNSRR